MVVIGECEWMQLKKERVERKQFVGTVEFVRPLNPHDAINGGRTNAVKLYHLADELVGETLKCYDFTTLYPHLKKCQVPYGDYGTS